MADNARGRSGVGGRRRRGAALDDAILRAALDELRAVGYQNVTMEAVAARARTSKPVLYRRWPNRAELVVAALRHDRPLLSGPVPDTGSLRGDVLALLRRVSQGLGDIGRETLFGLAAEYFQGGGDFFEDGLTAGRAAMHAIVQRAQVRGELPPGPVSERVLSVPVDLARHEMMFVARGPMSAASLEAIVDEVFLPLLRPRS